MIRTRCDLSSRTSSTNVLDIECVLRGMPLKVVTRDFCASDIKVGLSFAENDSYIIRVLAKDVPILRFTHVVER